MEPMLFFAVTGLVCGCFADQYKPHFFVGGILAILLILLKAGYRVEVHPPPYQNGVYQHYEQDIY